MDVTPDRPILWRIFDIAYDTDGHAIDDLPRELLLDHADLIRFATPEGDLDAAIADLLSDGTGWCVNGFQREVVPA